MLTMSKAKQPAQSAEAGVEDSREGRARIQSPIVECLRLEGRLLGIHGLDDMVRFALTERYRKMAWIRPGENNKLQFFGPPPVADDKK